MRFPHYALLLLTAFFAVCPLQAQRGADEVQPIINEIIIDFGQLHNVSREVVMAHVQVREGMTYDQMQVDRSMRSLYGTGLFDFIQIDTQELPGNRINLLFTLQSRYRIQDVHVSGNEAYTRRKLLNKAGEKLFPGNILDELSVRKAVDEIRDFYNSKGYMDARVDYTIERNPATGLGSIRIEIVEGERMRIRSISFEGNKEIDSDDLDDDMETSRWKWWLSWISGSGRLDEEKFAEDLDKIRTFYKDKGYLDVEISEDEVEINHVDGGLMDIVIHVHEGRKYYVGDITVEGERRSRSYTSPVCSR
jgi:outer membrane protein insertion porin family